MKSYKQLYTLYKNNTTEADYNTKNDVLSTLLTEDEVYLDEIIQKIKNYIKTDFPMKWQDKIILPDNTVVRKNLDNCFCFAFDWTKFSGKAKILNKIRCCFIGSTLTNNTPALFNSNDSSSTMAFYMSSMSNYKEGEENYGILIFNLHEFLQSFTKEQNTQKFFSELEETIFHEIRHYYDNLIGIFNPDEMPAQIIDMDLWLEECFDLNDNCERKHIAGKDLLSRFCYLNTPTELNAYINTFKIYIREYLIKHKNNFDLHKFFKYIHEHPEENYSLLIFTGYYYMETYSNFKNYIRGIISNDTILEDYFYLYNDTKINIIDKDRLKHFNDIFVSKYLDTINLSYTEIKEKLPNAFIKFMDKEYLPYIYNIMKNNYLKVFNTMCYIIETLINKYIDNK